jgi:ferric-dicitrate binding protein FerR (iron transport regulator)
VNRLWGNGKGRYRVTGHDAATAVKGTHWLTEDRCDGTFVRVASGTVTVADFGARRTVTVRAGHTYLARRR